MSEPARHAARPTDPVGRALHALSGALAIVGGLLACVIAVLVTVSVTGRYLFAAPVPGDNDLVGVLAGCAIFAFLPYCQMTRSNIMVDFFTARLSGHTKAVFDLLGTLLYLVIAILLTWRLYHGALELHASGEMLAAFTFYRWWTLPFDIMCMIILIAVIAYTLVLNIGEMRTAQRSV
jgi:TRAP-type C4-dicarboxylate transport system permease small subunit